MLAPLQFSAEKEKGLSLPALLTESLRNFSRKPKLIVVSRGM
ncbi:hypothetical protein ES703_117119 [subsurface metagenome]